MKTKVTTIDAIHSRATIEQFVAFVIKGIALEPWQHAHFTSCEQCRRATVEAVCAELDSQAALRFQRTL